MKKIKLKSQPKWVARTFISLWAVLWGILAFVSHPIWWTNAQSIECPEWKFLATWDVCITSDKDIVIQATATAANQTLKINKYFANAYIVDRWDGTTWDLMEDTIHTYENKWTYNIILSLTWWASRWKFYFSKKPLVPSNWTTMTWVGIIYMPSLADWFGDSATNVGNYFFSQFNSYWAIASLPEWSFDTSNITKVGTYFFALFNSYHTPLTTLPEWSFNISNISGTVGNNFFYFFNWGWSTTSLPAWSFDTSNITKVWDNFFYAFNGWWDLSGLPEWSFDISNISTVGTYFFFEFNDDWKLINLPEWSFDTSNITKIWKNFFSKFNESWYLTSLPEWSFDTSNITTVGVDFFRDFNKNWRLTSLPEWSFDTSNITTAADDFFYMFNDGWSLTSLPDWSFDTSDITTAGSYFFASFNNNWKLTSLPDWSFDTSNITTAGSYFFESFNNNWKLTSLPANSFNTENITTVGDDFFSHFNNNWSLTSLPEWSFRLSTWLTTVKGDFFSSFNDNWRLTSLPEWSFDTSNITTVNGRSFFASFNNNWRLTSLPEWSFDTSNITTAGSYFFESFNNNWSLTSLPEWSFNTSNITTAKSYFFASFNNSWRLTSLPEWSFDTSNITTAENSFFASFNNGWSLTSLPEWSFDTSNITTAADNFFYMFNNNWSLTSLPEWSFDTSNITTAAYGFFSSFNNNWRLTSLPEWSFDVSNIGTVWNYFFYRFNYQWKIVQLPSSFTMNSAWASASYNGYTQAFNSKYCTLNRKVSDIVSWATAPSSDKNTFSDNQPWRCGVNANWLESTKNACRITYNSNGWNTAITTKYYASNTTSVTVGTDIATPTRAGYGFKGWYTDVQTWIQITTIMFPEMDSWILYAHWDLNPTVTFDGNWWTTNLSSTTVERNTSIELPNAFREWYKFLWWYTDPDWWERVWWYNSSYIVTADITLYAHWDLNPTVTFDGNWWTTNLSSTTVERNTSIELPNAFREWYKFLWWYTDRDWWERVWWYNSSYIVTADITLYAYWEKYLVVTFDFNGGEWNSWFTYTLLDQLISPKRAKRDWYTLDWRYTSDWKKRDFSVDTVQWDMTLYAKRRVCGEWFVVEDNRCVPKWMELNWVIKVTNGDRTMYIRDRNVGVTSDAAVIYLKINTIENQNGKLWDNQCYNQCYNQCNNDDNDCYYECYDECYSQNFIETVEEELGISYENINEAYNSLSLDILEWVLPEKEMEAFLLNMEANSIFYQCEWNEDATCGQNEIIEYINTTFELEQELQEWDDVMDWLIEYFWADDFEEFNERYNNWYYRNLADRQADWNYYYRWNNSWVNYNDLEFWEDEWWNTTNEIINMGELVAKWFDWWKMWVEWQWWISWNVNPCNPEKWEFLPTPEDWKNLMEIWWNSNWYEIKPYEEDDYYEYDLDFYDENLDYWDDYWYNKFRSDLLMPYWWEIYDTMCWNSNTQQNNTPCKIFNNWLEIWTAQDEYDNVWDFYDMGLEYTNFNEVKNEWFNEWWNSVAMPVRCFVNPTEIPDVYVVSYETNEWSEINDVNVINWDTVNLPTPSRDGYTFLGWYRDQEYTRPFTATEPITSDTVLYAKWQDNATNTGVQPITSTNWWRLRKDKCPDWDFSDSYYDWKCGKNTKDTKATHNASSLVESSYQKWEELKYDTYKFNPNYSDEMNKAYQYSYYYGITTKDTVKNADMNWKLTRVAMAKMLSQYAINVLWKQPDKTRQNKFSDVSEKLDTEYDNWVTLAYQLWIMWINMPNNEFKPYNFVTRAEFATALSRLLYNIPDGVYEQTIRYYTPHINKLVQEWIITNTDPTMKELRWYVMLMLMRSAK